MLVRDVMTSKVVTIPSNTPVLEAERLIRTHSFERLPVVDGGKLVGLVTKDTLLKASPSEATSLSRSELFYLLSRLTVGEIMKKNVVTVSPDLTVERATAVAQKNGVGCLPVVERGTVVGILTTNDIFYKVINPLFGIGEGGRRLTISEAGDEKSISRVLELVSETGLATKAVWTPKVPGARKKDLIIQLDTEDIGQLVKKLRDDGFSVEERVFAA